MTDTTTTRAEERERVEERREDLAEAGEHRQDAARAAATREGAPIVGATRPGDGHAFFGEEQVRRLRSRWDDIQASFVDEPRDSVAAADELVKEATEALRTSFERNRRQLEGVWDRGDDVSTEDLRVTLQSYRSFFERVLSL